MATVIDLAIIIPTLNEEHYIGKLLDSIGEQTVSPKEIVVIDAESKDATIAEIKKRQKMLPQLKFLQIPKYTISRQRNLGVAKTKAANLLFLDSDVKLTDSQTLEKYWSQIEAKKPDFATAENVPLSTHWKDIFLFWLAHRMMVWSKPFWPMCVAINFYAKRSFFEKIGGFDEEVKVAEDFELLHRGLKKKGVYYMFTNVKIPSSVRRFRYEGRIRFTLKLFKSFFFIQMYGFQKNPIKYDLGKHQKVDV